IVAVLADIKTFEAAAVPQSLSDKLTLSEVVRRAGVGKAPDSPFEVSVASVITRLGLKVVPDHLELDRSVLERADGGPPAVVAAGGDVGLARFEVERDVADVTDL